MSNQTDVDYDSILISIKKLLGISYDYTHFDEDIIMHINSVFAILNQLGVGPENGFKIQSTDEKWSDFIDDVLIESVKTYVYLKVKMIFDPPVGSSTLDSMKNLISELEWRLNIAVDPKK